MGGQADRLRERVLAAVAVGAALGCSDRTIGDAGTAGGSAGSEDSSASDATTTTSASPTSTSTGGSSSPSTTSASATDDGSDDIGEVRFDLPGPDAFEPEPEPNPPEDCDDPGGEGFPCVYDEDPEAPLYYRCVDAPPEGCEAIDPNDVRGAGNLCLGQAGCGDHAFVDVACGPDPGADACCYWLVYASSICPGRPFAVDGEARLAAPCGREDWAVASTPNVDALSSAERAALAEAWTECASFEHASVASFARFVLQLLAVGAPASLLARAEEAMREELEHARAMFGLASAYAGRELGPSRLAIDGALANAGDLATIAGAAASEGCIAETISSLQIAIAAERATDPAVASMLRHIAEEELRHAELAWTFVSWSLARCDAKVRRAIANAFRNAERSIPRGPLAAASLSAKTLHAHGLLTPHEHLALAADALTMIILPAASRLFTHCSPTTDAHAS